MNWAGARVHCIRQQWTNNERRKHRMRVFMFFCV